MARRARQPRASDALLARVGFRPTPLSLQRSPRAAASLRRPSPCSPSLIRLLSQAPIIVWDFETGKILHKLELHKVLVQSLAFSCGDEYLATIGGQVPLRRHSL